MSGSKMSFLNSLQIGTSLALVALLLVGAPGTGLVGIARADSERSAVASISIATDPSGAAVFVDGKARGTTPLELDDVAPGAHRITVVKEGYLDNSRVVELSPDDRRSIQVNLTPGRTEERYGMQIGPSDDEGGGGAKWPLILGIAGGGAVAAALLLTGGNDPPTAGSISVRPTLGLVSVTSFSFNAQGANDPDGDSLTYSWDFGDGASGSGQSTTHIYTQTGSFNVIVTVSDGEGTATATTSVSTRDISGDWIGDFVGTGFTMRLLQSGTRVTGTYTDADGPGTVSGSLSGQREVRLTVERSDSSPFVFNGLLSADLDTIAGSVVGLGAATPFRMVRR